jgi:geranylgeranyl pyrophosphate synthase
LTDQGSASVQQALPLGIHMLEDALAETTASSVPFLESAARDLVKAGGKRLRPKFVFVSYLAAGGEPFPREAVDAACAIELFHTASLIHDDILDDADTRRGKPTVHRQLGIGRAIIVGDFVFGRAVASLHRLPQDVQNSIVQAGVDLAEGEALELELTRKGASTLEQYFTVIAKKTASLLETAAYAGARLANAPDDVVRHLADFGFYAGIAFQLVDDLLDVEGITEITGKPVGLDLQHGVPNAPLLVALEGQLRRGKKLVSIASARERTPEATRSLVLESKAPKRVLELAQMYAARAREALAALPKTKARAELERLLQESIDRDR